MQNQDQNVSIFKWFSFGKLCVADGQTPIPQSCPERGTRNSAVGNESPISSVVHQWSSNYMHQLAAELGPTGWRGRCAGLTEVSSDGGLERRSCVMICIAAKASEPLACVTPQINCQKVDQVIYICLSNILFSIGCSRLSIQLVELS